MRRLLTFGVLALAGFCAALTLDLGGDSATASPSAADALRSSGTVVRVIDGDTLDVRLLDGKIDRVRVLGIDSPEMRPRERCATQATAAARRIAQGKRVSLIGDSSQATRDRYRRLLAYVTLPSGSDLGRQLLEMGLATVYVFDKPFARVNAYRQAQGLAKKKRFGLWGSCSTTTTVIPAPPVRPAPPVAPTPTTTTPTTTGILPVLPTNPTTGTTTTAATTTSATTTTGTTTSGPPPPPPGGNCNASYPDVCIPPPPPDLNCSDISHRNFRVLHNVADPDPHRFDGNKDGRGCEN